MIELIDVKKDYISKNKEVVHALNGISFKFPSKGLVGIIGESGCGKTTLLNILGGIDTLTSGDVLVDDKSIKSYKDKDLDFYRNNKIGFIFQDNNLINNLTLFENVSLALSLSSIKFNKRKSKVIEVLKLVGLDKKIKKYPNELSGGEKQRATIARAIIKEPSIILADEPTGSLDKENSIEVMKLLKKLSESCLVIVVSHNEELLNEFANITLTISNGKINENYLKNIDSKEFLTKNDIKKKNKMSFLDCLKLSFKNVLFNKIKSLIVILAFALGIGSLGLVLSIKEGLSNYMSSVENETLVRFPISIERAALESSNVFELIKNDGTYPDKESFGLSDVNNNYLRLNNISTEFINYMDNIDEMYKDAIRINDTSAMNVVYKDTFSGKVKSISTSQKSFLSSMISKTAGSFASLPENKDVILDDYDVIYGHYPQNNSELVVILDSNNNLYENVANILGLNGLLNEGEISFSKLNELSFKLIDNNDLYKRKNISIDDSKVSAIFLKRGYDLFNDGLSVTDLINYFPSFDDFNSNDSSELDLNSKKETLKELIKYIDVPRENEIDLDDIDLNNEDELFNLITSLVSTRYLDLYQEINEDSLVSFFNDDSKGIKLNISGVLRPKKSTLYSTFNPGIYYLPTLGDEYKSRNNPEFIDENNNGKIDKEEDHRSNISKSYESNIFIRFDGTFSLCTRSILNSVIENSDFDSYLGNRKLFGLDNEVTSITIYPKNFDEKSAILNYIDEYNETQNEENKIYVTDLTTLVFSNMETMLSLVSLVLVIFSLICLIVGVLLETIIASSLINDKRKDIGILRSLGARKGDIISIFSFQSIVIGIFSAFLGVILMLIVGVILNLKINQFFSINNGMIVNFSILVISLIFIFSIVIQLIASFIPIIVNANKKPIDCIRDINT